MAKIAILTNSEILRCDKASVLKAVYDSAASHMQPDGKHGAIVVRNNKSSRTGKSATFQPMVKGIVQLIGQYLKPKAFITELVYTEEGVATDHFEYYIDSDSEHGEVLKHTPLCKSRTQRNAIKVYAILKTLDGGQYITVMDREDVMAAKKASRTKYIWEGDFWKEMWIKTVIHRLYKRLPVKQEELAVAMAAIEENSDFSPETKPLAEPPPKRNSAKVNDLVDKEKAIEVESKRIDPMGELL